MAQTGQCRSVPSVATYELAKTAVMKLPLYQIDAFTSRLFGGNPAAVVLLAA